MGNPLLAAGRLDRRVRIMRPSYTTNARNERIEGEPALHAEVWASVKPAPGVERFQNAETAASAPMRIVTRWRAGLVAVTDTIEADDRSYSVLWWAEIGRREGIEILAQARAETEE